LAGTEAIPGKALGGPGPRAIQRASKSKELEVAAAIPTCRVAT